MFKAALRSARPAVLAARVGVKSANAASLRALSTTVIRRSDGHHASAPSLYGTGAKEGEVPTDEAQSTGLDRVQVLGNLEGVEVFDLNPLDASRIGTLADPIKVFSVEPDRIIGCTGYPADSHDILWMNLTKEKVRRCPECGSAYALEQDAAGPVVHEVHHH